MLIPYRERRPKRMERKRTTFTPVTNHFKGSGIAPPVANVYVNTIIDVVADVLSDTSTTLKHGRVGDFSQINNIT